MRCMHNERVVIGAGVSEPHTYVMCWELRTYDQERIDALLVRRYASYTMHEYVKFIMSLFHITQ